MIDARLSHLSPTSAARADGPGANRWDVLARFQQRAQEVRASAGILTTLLPALPIALADTIVPDFPLTNKSFNLSYAGNDL